MPPQQSSLRNRLLRALPGEEYDSLSPLLQPLLLPREFSLARVGAPLDYVYFFESGICSIVVRSPEGQQIEAGIFGREGLGPPAVISGIDRSALDIYVQVPGEGFRVPTNDFAELLDACPALERLAKYAAYLMGLQTTFTSLSNAVHQVDERLARWLLMCHDRTEGDEISLTHEFIALMLAVRRPSVTTALHTLEGGRFIRSERGHITIRDRAGLEDFAADAYGVPEREYARLLGPMR